MPISAPLSLRELHYGKVLPASRQEQTGSIAKDDFQGLQIHSQHSPKPYDELLFFSPLKNPLSTHAPLVYLPVIVPR